MVNLTIDDQKISVEPGTSLLEAAEGVGIHIPRLCYLKGYEPSTSCMLCVVHDLETDRLVPSCGMPAAEGMTIQTNDADVRSSRKDTLDLLLSEHIGDCIAPCQRACPAHMDVPEMVRLIESEQWDDAIATVKRDVALPAVLGRICPAPCESGCNRKPHDGSVSVCMLKRAVADADLDGEKPYRPDVAPPSGKRVAIVGGGPAGLSAAYYLLQQGHAAHIYDKHAKLGGELQYSVMDEDLPKSVLDAEIDQIVALGLEFHPETSLGEDISLKDLRNTYDAVIIAIGAIDVDTFDAGGLKLTKRGIAIERNTYETNLEGVFAGGNAVSEARRAIRSLAQGKEMATSVGQYLNGEPVVGEHQGFASRIGKLVESEIAQLLQIATPNARTAPEDPDAGLALVESVDESSRCLRCGCSSLDSCTLRVYAEEYGASQARFQLGERKLFERIYRQGGRIVFEPGKCIKCGLCIQVAEKEGEDLGLAFVGRGFDVQVGVPFNGSFDDGMKRTAQACIDACPTGAISWRDPV